MVAPLAALVALQLTAADLAVVVNDADRLSVATAQYYVQRRAIPAENVIHVRFEAGRPTLSEAEFTALRTDIVSRTPTRVQAYALTWTQPYRVDCMSMTTAFAAGFAPAFCSDRCTATRWSPYYNSNADRPYDRFGLRPAMSVAASSIKADRELIDRGIASDDAHPQGRAYLVETNDVARKVRAAS